MALLCVKDVRCHSVRSPAEKSHSLGQLLQGWPEGTLNPGPITDKILSSR